MYAINSSLEQMQNPDGALKFKKLRKLVLKSLRDSGSTDDKIRVSEMLEQKVSYVLFARNKFSGFYSSKM